MRAIRTLAATLAVLGAGACLLLGGGPVAGQEEPGPFGGDDAGNAPDPGSEAPSTDASTPDYLAALELQRKGRWKSAKKKFIKILDEFPNSVHAEDCDLRGGDNAFLGVVRLHEGGPPERRIDFAVMGDGFTIDTKSQKKEEDWAKLCVDVLMADAAYVEYLDYFNFYYVRLASLEEGIDPSDVEKAKIEERNKKRRASRRKPTDFSTALNCKSGGPQGQVYGDRSLVYKWLDYAAREMPGVADDRLVIAFAQFGRLGMGGGGIAWVGRPDKSVTVHEVGHCFVGLLDEYANNPYPPRRAIRAANASTDPEDVPWQHWIDHKGKYSKDIGVYEGGATHKKGVWRPARSCAMNSAGNSKGYCAVCREACVLRIYNIVNPIDTSSPVTTKEMLVLEGDESQILVTPMQPAREELAVEWFVQTIEVTDPGPELPEEDGPNMYAPAWKGQWYSGGERGREDREPYDRPPDGELSRYGQKSRKSKSEPRHHWFPTGKLLPGRYRITVQVKDETKWVIKDELHLLEERMTWWVTVAPKQ